MKNLARSLPTLLNISGFMALFVGASLAVLDTRSAEAQLAPGGGNPCGTCGCFYPNSGWCDSQANFCGYNISGCGCSYIDPCSQNVLPTDTSPY